MSDDDALFDDLTQDPALRAALCAHEVAQRCPVTGKSGGEAALDHDAGARSLVEERFAAMAGSERAEEVRRICLVLLDVTLASSASEREKCSYMFLVRDPYPWCKTHRPPDTEAP